MSPLVFIACPQLLFYYSKVEVKKRLIKPIQHQTVQHEKILNNVCVHVCVIVDGVQSPL